jgi:hypothetical protein
MHTYRGITTTWYRYRTTCTTYVTPRTYNDQVMQTRCSRLFPVVTTTYPGLPFLGCGLEPPVGSLCPPLHVQRGIRAP